MEGSAAKGKLDPGLTPPDGGSGGQVVVLLPTLDEEEAIGDVLDRIPRAELERRRYRVSAWVVDGQSSDATREIAMRRNAAIFVQRGDGKGTGVAQAFRYLSGTGRRSEGSLGGPTFYFMLDADGTYPPEYIPRFLVALEAGYDLVLGSRFRGRIEDGAVTKLNYIGNLVLNQIARLIYGLPVTDVCTGMWGLNEDLVRKFSLAAHGFDLEAEMFASACNLDARFAEVPIEYRRRTGHPKLVPFEAGLLIAWRLLKPRLTRGDRQRWSGLRNSAASWGDGK